MTEMESSHFGSSHLGVAHSFIGAVWKQGDFLAFQGVCNFSLGVVQGMWEGIVSRT